MTKHEDSHLDQARSAVGRLAWDEAMDAFTAADGEEPLGPGDLAQWAMVAYLMGRTR